MAFVMFSLVPVSDIFPLIASTSKPSSVETFMAQSCTSVSLSFSTYGRASSWGIYVFRPVFPVAWCIRPIGLALILKIKKMSNQNCSTSSELSWFGPKEWDYIRWKYLEIIILLSLKNKLQILNNSGLNSLLDLLKQEVPVDIDGQPSDLGLRGVN